MSVIAVLLFCACAATVAGLPRPDQVLLKLDDGPRYRYQEDSDGRLHLADHWRTVADVANVARFDPERQIVYHLFTRLNPSVSQPMLMGSIGLLSMTNYDASKRTIFLLHGWRVSATADMNNLLVPACLSAEDVNIIVVDWSAGAGDINYGNAVANTVTAGEGVARFIDWLNQVTGADPSQYHIIGHNLGGHQAGIIGRNVNGKISYITALEASSGGFVTNEHRFRPDDGAYTEVIHTNAGALGFLTPLGQVDFYPNAGVDMPGCSTPECSHSRSYFYLAESIQTGGFTGRRCASYISALSGNCSSSGTLRMGGLVPKTGSSGVYYMRTNRRPLFSRG